MLKNIVKAKKTWIIVIVLLLLCGCILIGFWTKQDKEEAGKNDVENDVVVEYDVPGLEIDGANEGEHIHREDSVDVSGTWESTDSNTEKDGVAGSKDDASCNDMENNVDTDEDNSEDNQNNEDIIVDDKEWGKIF